MVTSETIAAGTEVQHKNVLGLIVSHAVALERFGQVAFQTRPGYNNAPVRVALLNEQQSTLVLTLMRNSEKVVAFKVALVTAFFDMAQQLAKPRELSRTELAQMVIAAEEEKAALAAKVQADAPAVEYVERFVAKDDDLLTVDNFAAQYATTGPTVRQLFVDHGVAVRRQVGSRWSASQERMVGEFEWRPRAGVLSQSWFELRPQHNAPRNHNGQVKQTMYVRQFHAETLAKKLGLA
jgi:phage regulator Rha-like protein